MISIGEQTTPIKDTISLVNSGSSANLVAAMALAEKIKQNGKNLLAAVSAFTFPTTVSSLISAGFEAVMIDMEQGYFNMDIPNPELLFIKEEKICGNV